MAAWRPEKLRPKSSQPISKLQQSRLKSEESSKTLPHQRIKSSIPEDFDASKSLKVLKEVTEIPGTVRVCSGTFITKSGQSISKDTKLYVHEKIQRKVVQIKCCYPKTTRFVNIPLNSRIQIGFKHGTVYYQNIREVVKHNKTLPKLLCVVKHCQCNGTHQLSESNVLIVQALRNKELLVWNVSNQEMQTVPKTCSASFTTDPKQACICIHDLNHLPQVSLLSVYIVPKESLDVFESPQRNQYMAIEKFSVEECLKVQMIESTEMHLLPSDAKLEVVTVHSSNSRGHEFPVSTYELMEPDVLNQPTIMEYPRRSKSESCSSCGSLPMSPPGSSRSSASSIQTSNSSIEMGRPSISECPPPLELKLMNLLYETREVTRVFVFGLNLGIPEYILKSLEAEFPHNLERRRAGLFSYWLKTNVHASWKEIIEALKKIGETRLSERLKVKTYQSADSGNAEILLPNLYYDEDVDRLSEERAIKEEFRKLEGDLHDMREQLQFIENLSMFQKPEDDTQYQSLLDMKKKVELLELETQAYPLNVRRSKLTSDTTTHEKKSAGVGLMQAGSNPDSSFQTYYNAIPLNDHRYISKLFASEEQIVQVELAENKARQDVLENGKTICEKKLLELNAYTDLKFQHRDIIGMCYHLRLVLNITSYKHRLAILEVQREELLTKIAELREEMNTEKTFIQKRATCYPNLLPNKLQQYFCADSPIHPSQKKPVPKPRSRLTHPKISDRFVRSVRMDVRTSPTSPQNPLPTFEGGIPTPFPRKRGVSMGKIIRPLSQEHAYETIDTQSLSRPQPQLPNIEVLPGNRYHTRPMTSIASRNHQKPPVTPRRKMSSPVKIVTKT